MSLMMTALWQTGGTQRKCCMIQTPLLLSWYVSLSLSSACSANDDGSFDALVQLLFLLDILNTQPFCVGQSISACLVQKLNVPLPYCLSAWTHAREQQQRPVHHCCLVCFRWKGTCTPWAQTECGCACFTHNKMCTQITSSRLL